MKLIYGSVCCLGADFMAATIVALFSEVDEEECSLNITDAKACKLSEDGVFGCSELDDSEGWVFAYYAEDEDIEGLIVNKLEELILKGVVYDYTLEYMASEDMFDFGLTGDFINLN